MQSFGSACFEVNPYYGMHQYFILVFLNIFKLRWVNNGYYLFIYLFIWLYPWHVKVPGPGAEPKP